MAAIPNTWPISYDTNLEPDEGKRTEKAEDGTPIVLNFYAKTLYDGTIVIPWATDIERDEIRAFYEANKNLIFSFTHPGDGRTYSLYFTNAPKEERLEALDQRWKISLMVIGTL